MARTFPAGNQFFARMAACGLMALLAACASNPPKTAPLDSLKAEAAEPAAPYRIGIGDEIEIKFLFAPDLNDRLTVRPDGKISVMFAQDVQAAGQTTEELAAALKKKLAKRVKQLDMLVVVRTFGSQRVFVGGEVMRPGPVQLVGRENILQVLNQVGWITPEAGGDKIVLVRRDAEGRENLYPVNLDRLVKGEAMAQNIFVQAGDVILVPPSDAVEADRWIDQNIRKILPFSTGASVVYGINTRGTP
ncbi:MAG: polysaccharide biosynthesis/export family protein [Alphaproteobacteria bacterium]|nr:polysaccharide biosynthesis/export family protein [Alphaproteobacteria bacterium]